MVVLVIERSSNLAKINGSRYVRYDLPHVAAAVLVHEQAVDLVRELDRYAATAKAPPITWQVIERSGGFSTRRLQVPGGWLVRVVSSDGATMEFVPDTRHAWIAPNLDLPPS